MHDIESRAKTLGVPFKRFSFYQTDSQTVRTREDTAVKVRYERAVHDNWSPTSQPFVDRSNDRVESSERPLEAPRHEPQSIEFPLFAGMLFGFLALNAWNLHGETVVRSVQQPLPKDETATVAQVLEVSEVLEFDSWSIALVTAPTLISLYYLLMLLRRIFGQKFHKRRDV